MTCAVRTCTNDRQRDSLFCPDCLNLMWANRLERQDDGTWTVREWDRRPEWLKRLTARDNTGEIYRDAA